LNASSTEAVMKLYAPDAVLMGEYAPSAVGAAAVCKAYDAVFKAIQIQIKFKIEEVMQLAPDWAFARSNSNGKVTVHANNASLPEANQELFTFQRVGDAWKIARYSFSSINPPNA
jgi:ketosteroid isomerase-like protein